MNKEELLDSIRDCEKASPEKLCAMRAKIDLLTSELAGVRELNKDLVGAARLDEESRRGLEQTVESLRLWKSAAHHIQAELDLANTRAATAEATAVWCARERVYYEAAGVISEGPLIVIPEACSTDEFPFSSFDCLDDDADVYRVLQETRKLRNG